MPRFSPPPALLPGERPSAAGRARRYAAELWWVSFLCLFVTLPVTVWEFHAVTPWAPIANLVVVPAAFLLFFAGAAFFLAFAWLPAPFAVVPGLMKPLMDALAASLFFFEGLPGAYIVTGRPHPALCAVLVAGLAALFSPPVRSRRLRACAIVLFAANVFLAQEALRHLPRPLRVTFLDVGQGDAAFVEFPRGGNMLVDAGSARSGDRGRRVIAPFLRERGVRRIDAAVVSHPQEDHLGGFEAVFDAVEVGAVVEARRSPRPVYRRFDAAVRKERARRIAVSRGFRLEGWRGAEVEVFHPADARHSDVNDDSVVLRVSSEGSSVLFTGDAGEPAMRDLLTAVPGPLDADLLKVPHHGAKTGKTGERFFAAVSPAASVISAGERNPFGHPRSETLRALEREGAVARTDRDGALVFEAEKGGFRAVRADF